MSELFKGVLFDGQVRFTAIDFTDIVQAARETHGLSPLASAALGRTMSGTLMIASDLKNEQDRMSVTIKGDGPIKNIVVVTKSNGHIKGTVGDPHVDLPLNDIGKLDVAGAVGRGTLTILEDLGLKKPYIGMVELQSGEIGDDFAYYLMTSEQRPSIFYVGVLVDTDCSVKSASGLLVEPLPECKEEFLAKLEENALTFAKLNSILGEGKTLKEAINQIFEGMTPKILETRHPEFICDCSGERMEQALSSLPAEELLEMADEDDGAQIVCQFCHKEYNYSAEQLRKFAKEQ